MSLLRLLTWASPAFPTGGYAYSHGLEWAVEAGDLQTEAQALDWIDAVLSDGTGRQDAILMRAAYAGSDVAALAAATAPSAERRAETVGQGAAFALAAAVWDDVSAAAYPVAWGNLARQQGVSVDDAMLAMLHALAANLVSAAVRLVPLGQTAGLRIMAALQPTILRIARDPADDPTKDLGGACFRSDIAAMRHETQYTRLFRT